jgi:hypothetical protein
VMVSCSNKRWMRRGLKKMCEARESARFIVDGRGTFRVGCSAIGISFKMRAIILYSRRQRHDVKFVTPTQCESSIFEY